MENLKNLNSKSSQKNGKFSKFTPILVGALFLMNPSGTNAQNISNYTRTKAEVSTSNLLDRLNQKLGVSLPGEYNGKVLDFVLNDTIMRTRSATTYTEEFIINEMQKDRGISKQDQLLFIWSKIYGGISQKKLYNRLDDENVDRSAEYKKSLKQIATCYEEYKKGFKTYMETGIAEADRRSAEADRRSAEADRRSAEADRRSAEADRRSAQYKQESAEADRRSAEAIRQTMKADSLGLKELVKYYNLCMKNPETNDEDEMLSVRNAAKEIIKNCKKYGINYEDVMIKEVKKTDRLNDTDAKEKVDMILMWVEGPDFADKKEKGREPSTNHYKIMDNDSKPDSI